MKDCSLSLILYSQQHQQRSNQHGDCSKQQETVLSSLVLGIAQHPPESWQPKAVLMHGSCSSSFFRNHDQDLMFTMSGQFLLRLLTMFFSIGHQQWATELSFRYGTTIFHVTQCHASKRTNGLKALFSLIVLLLAGPLRLQILRTMVLQIPVMLRSVATGIGNLLP